MLKVGLIWPGINLVRVQGKLDKKIKAKAN